MKIGTKSVLFGVHCFFIHPFYVAKAWKILYPDEKRKLQHWVAFFVHDLGYIGCEKMDDEKGEMHPYFGANIMHKLFDYNPKNIGIKKGKLYQYVIDNYEPYFDYWYEFTLYHSRFLAKKNNAQYSKLCVADKLAITLTPKWLYLICANLTGEIKEYMKDSSRNSNGLIEPENKFKLKNQLKWKKSVDEYVTKWVEEHKDLKEDL